MIMKFYVVYRLILLKSHFVLIVEKKSIGQHFRFMVFNSAFSNISLYRSGQCYWLRKPEYSGTCAIRHPSFPTSCDIRQKFMVPKYFSELK